MFPVRRCIAVLCFLCINAYSQDMPGTALHTEGTILQHGFKTTDTATLLKAMDNYLPLAYGTSDSALQLFQDLLLQSRNAQFHLGIAKALNSIGHIYWNKSRYEQALKTFAEAAYYAAGINSLNGKNILCQAYNNTANIYQYWGNFQQATAYYFKAAVIAAQNPKAYERIQLIYCNLGITEQQSTRALYYLEKADSISRSKNDMEILEFALLNKANIYEKAKQWQPGITALTEVYALSLERKEPLMQYRSLYGFASLYHAMNEPAKALQYISKAEAVYPGGDNDSYQENINNRIAGNVYLQMKNYPKAEYYLLKAVNDAQQINARKNNAEACNSLALLYAATGRHAEAFRYQQVYMQLKDSLLNEKIAENAGNLEVRFRTAEKDKDIIQKQLEIANQNRQILKKNILIGSIATGSVGLVLTLSILFVNSRRRRRLLQQQQEIEQLKAIMKGEEKERNRLARELHDGIGGMLAAIKMNVGSAIKEYPEEARMINLENIEQLLSDTSAEVRKTAHNLMPDVLTKYDLAEALSLYCHQINAGNTLRAELQLYGPLSRLNKAVELILYRMIQELIQNIIKHAHATRAEIQIMLHEESLHISVEDNGSGFDPQARTSGSGLENLRFRVQALQGQIAILSAKDRSTTIHVAFDLQKLENTIDKL